MAQRNQISWGELRVGLFVLAGVTLLIMATFYVTGFGILASKYGLITYLPEVSQLTKGAPVRLDGVVPQTRAGGCPGAAARLRRLAARGGRRAEHLRRDRAPVLHLRARTGGRDRRGVRHLGVRRASAP